MTNQVNHQMVAPANPKGNALFVIVQDFTQINPLEFYGLKVDEYPHDFIDEVKKIIRIMGITPVESSDLVSYHMKGVAQI